MKYLIVLLLLLLGGCSANSPYYFEVGAGYQINGDYWVEPERPWTCHSPVSAHFELGRELDDGWSLALHHKSYWSCGSPFNNRPEIHEDELLLKKRWGG